MATLFENSVSQNTRCYSCGSIVYAVEKKITTKHVYHNRCFRCRICKRNLTGFSLNEEGDDIYCGNCYRKKQRGDCNSFEFYRAAAEKAQYVHSRQAKTQQNALSNPRPSRSRDTTRNPSLTLRHLERQLNSQQPKNNINDKENTEENAQKPPLPSLPSTPISCFSPTNNFKSFRRDLSETKDDSTHSFQPIFSSNLTRRTEAVITPRIANQTDDSNSTNGQTKTVITSPTTQATSGIEFRLNISNNDISYIASPLTNRKSIIIPDLNNNTEQSGCKIRFAEFNMRDIHRRSCSAHHAIRPSRID